MSSGREYHRSGIKSLGYAKEDSTTSPKRISILFSPPATNILSCCVYRPFYDEICLGLYLLLWMTYFGAVTLVRGGMRTSSTIKPFGPVIRDPPVIAGGINRSASCVTPLRCGRAASAFPSFTSMPSISAWILAACSGYLERNHHVPIKAARVVSLHGTELVYIFSTSRHVEIGTLEKGR